MLLEDLGSAVKLICVKWQGWINKRNIGVEFISKKYIY